MSKLIDLTGRRFGKLTVVKRAEDHIKPNGDHMVQWLCKCDCGNKAVVAGISLKGNKTKSCGCIVKELTKEIGKRNKKYNIYDLTGKYGIGYTSNTSKPFYFDLEDYDLIKDYCWSENSNGYISNGKNDIKIHRLIMKPPKNKVVDHINHDKLDNRKNNLRICNQSQNILNKSLRKESISGVTGVVWSYNKWKAQIKIDGQYIYLGCFERLEDAIKVRRQAEEKYFGEYANKEHSK